MTAPIRTESLLPSSALTGFCWSFLLADVCNEIRSSVIVIIVVIDADILCSGSLLGSIEIVVHSFLCVTQS